MRDPYYEFENTTLHVVSGRKMEIVADEVYRRVHYMNAEFSSDYQDIGASAKFTRPKRKIGYAMLWDSGGNIGVHDLFKQLDDAVSQHAVVAGNPPPSEMQLNGDLRAGLKVIVGLGVDCSEHFNSQFVHQHQGVIGDPHYEVHYYTTLQRTREVHDIKRYIQLKSEIKRYYENREFRHLPEYISRHDGLLYLLDRLGWTYHTFVSPDDRSVQPYQLVDPAYQYKTDENLPDLTAEGSLLNVLRNQNADVESIEPTFQSI